jgi:hypothetical protein
MNPLAFTMPATKGSTADRMNVLPEDAVLFKLGANGEPSGEIQNRNYGMARRSSPVSYL